LNFKSVFCINQFLCVEKRINHAHLIIRQWIIMINVYNSSTIEYYLFVSVFLAQANNSNDVKMTIYYDIWLIAIISSQSHIKKTLAIHKYDRALLWEQTYSWTYIVQARLLSPHLCSTSVYLFNDIYSSFIFIIALMKVLTSDMIDDLSMEWFTRSNTCSKTFTFMNLQSKWSRYIRASFKSTRGSSSYCLTIEEWRIIDTSVDIWWDNPSKKKNIFYKIEKQLSFNTYEIMCVLDDWNWMKSKLVSFKINNN
jgi:hypothetical protein